MIPILPLAEAVTAVYGDFVHLEKRLEKLKRQFINMFAKEAQTVVSVPGRIELSGNHTDHQQGQVLAAAVDLDMLAAFEPLQEAVIRIYSCELQQLLEVNLQTLSPQTEEQGHATALIRGVASALHQQGFAIGGFQAVVHSRVGMGSGLSSSAAFEVLVGTILNFLYNKNQIPPETIARMGQIAENQFYGKPCGLMDQLTCAIGGILHIDFKSLQNPRWEVLPDVFTRNGWQVVIINTGSAHHDLTTTYSEIPREMKSVAAYFGKSVLREVTWEAFLQALPHLRQAVGDRAVLRAFHFFQENFRVTRQRDALRQGKVAMFLQLLRESGDSSFKYLQNVVLPQSPQFQPLGVVLALCEEWTRKHGGACRVHGGGFAGTVLALIPEEKVPLFTREMSQLLGQDVYTFPELRKVGAVVIRL